MSGSFRAFNMWCIAVALLLAARYLISEKVLYEKESEFNNIIVTEEPDKTRVLSFKRNNMIMSRTKPGDPDFLFHQYTKVAFCGLAAVEDTDEHDRFLFVGIGGGAMPMFLHRRYPDAMIDAVDINPDVVRVAEEFLGFRQDANLNAHVADARAFLENATYPYDAIFLDAYDAEGAIPLHLATVEFLRSARRALKPGGVVIANVWSRDNPLFKDMIRTYQEAFEELYMLDITQSRNKLLVSLPRRQQLDHGTFVEKARQVGFAHDFPFDLGAIQQHQFHDLSRKSEGKGEGRVLVDADIKISE